MCKADAASYSSRADLGVGFERAFAAQSVLDDRLRIGLAEFNAGAFEFERRRAPRLVNQACWQLDQFRQPCTGSRAWMPGTRPGVTRCTKTCCLALPRNDEPLLRLRHDTNIGFRRFPALRIDRLRLVVADRTCDDDVFALLPVRRRSEEHTSELQSQFHLVCRLLLEKKKNLVLHRSSAYSTTFSAI